MIVSVLAAAGDCGTPTTWPDVALLAVVVAGGALVAWLFLR